MCIVSPDSSLSFGNQKIKNKSAGNLEASVFVVQKMDNDNNGASSAKVSVEKELKVKDYFPGKVFNSGKAPETRKR